MSSNFEELLELFSSECGQVAVNCADQEVEDEPGILAIYVDSPESLPSPFDKELAGRPTNLLYIGESKKLHKRLIKQNLGGGTSTCFISIGTMLGYKPEYGSLVNKRRNKYTFSASDKKKIIDFIKQHFFVKWKHCNINDKKLLKHP